METVVKKSLEAGTVEGLRGLKERIQSLSQEFQEIETQLREMLPHFKEWTIRKTELQPVWYDFEELFKADYHGTDHELYEVIVDPEGKLQVTRL